VSGIFTVVAPASIAAETTSAFDVGTKFTRHPDSANRTLDDFFLRHLELVFAMDCAGRHEHVNTVPLRAFDRRMNLFDVVRVTAGEAADDGAEILVCDRLYRLEVARRRRRKPGFDNVHVQFGQRFRNAQLLS
jgi:hypothetical protein